MDCERARAELAARLLGEEAALGTAELDVHLAGCSACAAMFAREQLLVGAIDLGLRAVAAVEPSPGAEAALRARIAAGVPTPRRGVGRWWIPLAAAAAATVALVVISQPRRGDGPRSVVAELASPTVAAMAARPMEPPTAAAPREETAVVPRLATSRAVEVVTPPVRSKAGRRPRPRDREVVVPPGQWQAVADLMAVLWTGPAEMAVAVPRTELVGLRPAAPIELATLGVEPIEVRPLRHSAEHTELFRESQSN